jgi:ATP-dependent DNA helicase RecQ
LPSECLLFFSAGDVMKYMGFIDEKPDPQEQKIAREQLQQMVHYAEGSECRRAALLRYFGEQFESENCGACDNCLSPRATYDGTIAAQKFLSCVFRVREKSGFDFGINQIAEVLTGANTEGVRKWNHQTVSTYGIGQEHGRDEWKGIGRELVRLGYLRQIAEKFNVLTLTDEGRAVLRERKKVTLTKTVEVVAQEKSHVGEIACDEVLFNRLRELRKKLADERNVPAYIVFSDVALRQMARTYPSNEYEFSRISGVGQAKRKEFAAVFLAEIAAHLRENPKQIFADDSFAPPAAPPNRARLNDTTLETLRRFRAGDSIEEIATKRSLVTSTVCGHLTTAIEAGESLDLNMLFSKTEQQEIAGAFAQFGFANIVGVHEALGKKFDFGPLRIYRAAAQRK